MQISRSQRIRTTVSAIAITSLCGFAVNANAQDAEPVDEIVATGIIQSLENAIVEKRNANNLKEVIKAEDIGKLPDQNLAEVLENITGIQIDRTAGVGTAVQIRGTGSNRVEINGVSTVGAGTGRSGISFDDLPAALISSVEVTKVPEAKTVEGSVGGTINLRTLRGLELQDQVASIRVQAEHSDLADTVTPRVSGTYGNNWSNPAGQELGIVLSGSYAQQDNTSFDPRFDRDREVLPGSGRTSEEDFPFFRTQFLDQQHRNFEYETLNVTGSFQYSPSDNLMFYLDGTLNSQERLQKSNRVQISGTGDNNVVDATTNTSFETVQLGSIDGPDGTLDLGSVQAVLTGVLGVGNNTSGGINPNLRAGVSTGSRETDSVVLAAGGEWTGERLTATAEFSRSTSDTLSPGFNTNLDFVNPNGPQPSVGNSSDNGVPVQFDASGDTLQFGIATGAQFAPSSAELLNPANYRLRQVSSSESEQDNTETALRLDLSYDVEDMNTFFTTVDAGARWNENTSINDDVTQSFNYTSANSPIFFRPTGDLFASLLVPGIDNFDAADDRNLFFQDYLVVNPDLSLDDPAAVRAALNEAISQANRNNGVNMPLIDSPSTQLNNFFDITETTQAFYLQGNYATENLGFPVRGNVGVRWVNTDLDSTANVVIEDVNGNDVVGGENSDSSSYSFFLPRFNLVAEPMEDLLIRGGIARDLRRPSFNDLSLATRFIGGAGGRAEVGNPQLEPETVWSFDLSGEYYLSRSSLISVGVFHKERENLIARAIENAAETPGAGGQIERDITPPCEGGGTFNPTADRNVFSSIQGQGICVDRATQFNVDGTTTQTGVELGLQYNLSEMEDRLGWLSGFGVIGNFTYQESGGDVEEFYNGNGDGNALNDILGRTDSTNATATLADDVVRQRIELSSLSETAYNATLFYDKYGVNFRARYTWRSNFFSPGTFVSFNLPRIIDDRGQLNASLSYEIKDGVTLGIEGVNLLREDRTEWCVNDDALLCAQGLTDRRIIGGLSVQF